MGEKAKKMYDKDKAPKLGRDEKGNVEVKPGKGEPSGGQSEETKKTDATGAGTEGALSGDHEMNHSHERTEMHHRHVHEKLQMHARHEREHDMHEGHKGPLHVKHQTEMKEMHDRHEKEMKAMHTRHEQTTEGGKEGTHGAEDGVEKEKKTEKAKTGEAGEKK